MKNREDIQEMYNYIVGLQKEAEHYLDEHFLMPHERQKHEQTLVNTSAEAQVLEWVLADAEVAIAG